MCGSCVGKLRVCVCASCVRVSCVRKLCDDVSYVGKLCGDGGLRGEEGGGSAQPKTRTPHKDVGKNEGKSVSQHVQENISVKIITSEVSRMKVFKNVFSIILVDFRYGLLV